MAYDGTGPWDPNAPGQHSSYAFAQNNTTYWLNRGLPKAKAVLGLPFYGYGFGNDFSNEAKAYNQILATHPGAENVDQTGSTIWYNGIPTIKAKTTYALDQNIGGVMIWSLDNDAPGSKSLLTAINDAIIAKLGTGPVLTITAPANGTGFKAADNITISATATDADGVTKVEFFNGAAKIGEDLTSPYSYIWNNVAAGTYVVNVKATDTKGNTSTRTVNVGVQGAYNNTIANIPGKIEAENYDLGGQDVAYNDDDAINNSSQYRAPEGVDFEYCEDGGIGYNLSYTAATEWIEYTVNVTTAGAYTLEARVASTAAGKTFHVELNGTNISGTITVPNTTGWQVWQTVSVKTPSLTVGQKVLRIVIDTDGFNLNYINFVAIPQVNTPVITGAATANGTTGTAFTYNIIASNTPASYGATGLPAGRTVNTTTGLRSGTPTAAGTFAATVTATNAGGTGTKTVTITVTAAPVPQAPYNGTAANIPGKIEAEHFDNGGEGVAYHDTEAENKFNLFRTNEGVDVEATGDGSGVYNLGWIVTGEWLEYSVNVQTAGAYTLETRVASGSSAVKAFHVEMDGVNISGPVSFNATAGWQVYQTVSVKTTALTTGNKIMRIVVDAGDFNLNFVNFVNILVTGIDQGQGTAAVAVFPNPVKAGGSISITNEITGVSQVNIYNYLGQSVFQTSLNSAGGTYVHTLDLPQNLPAGYYQLEIKDAAGHSKMQKIVVQ